MGAPSPTSSLPRAWPPRRGVRASTARAPLRLWLPVRPRWYAKPASLVEPATVRAFLASTATDRYTPGVDNVTGYGEVTLPALPPAGFDASRFNPVTPFRLIDTRLGQGEPPGKVAPGGVVKATVAGVGPVPASGVTAVVLNVTATQSTAARLPPGLPARASHDRWRLDAQPRPSVPDRGRPGRGARRRGRQGGRLRPPRLTRDHRRLRLLHEGGGLEGRPVPRPQPRPAR